MENDEKFYEWIVLKTKATMLRKVILGIAVCNVCISWSQ
jgi:hypothetical protein